MKIRFLVLALFAVSSISNAQTYRLTWGEEMKWKKGTTDLDIVAADNSGIYIAEAHVTKALFAVGDPYNVVKKLIRFDKNYEEVYNKDFKKELDDYDFHSFQAAGDDLFLLATSFAKKEKAFKVFGAKVDKSSGELVAPLQELGSHIVESKKDDRQLRAEVVEGGNGLLLVADVSTPDRTRVAVDVLDRQLIKKQSTVIALAYAPGHYRLADVKLTPNRQIVLLGKEMESVGEGKKARLVFKQFTLAV